MSYVNRTNPSKAGMGACGCPSCASPSLAALGMDTYSVIGYEPPSQTGMGFIPGNISALPFNPIGGVGIGGVGMGDIQNQAISQPGSAASTIANTTPDIPSPTAQAVVQSFSNDTSGAQPGVLPLYPNETADTLSFVTPPAPVVSPQCEFFGSMNANPWLFILGAAGVAYLMSKARYREYRARKKAA